MLVDILEDGYIQQLERSLMAIECLTDVYLEVDAKDKNKIVDLIYNISHSVLSRCSKDHSELLEVVDLIERKAKQENRYDVEIQLLKSRKCENF